MKGLKLHWIKNSTNRKAEVQQENRRGIWTIINWKDQSNTAKANFEIVTKNITVYNSSQLVWEQSKQPKHCI